MNVSCDSDMVIVDAISNVSDAIRDFGLFRSLVREEFDMRDLTHEVKTYILAKNHYLFSNIGMSYESLNILKDYARNKQFFNKIAEYIESFLRIIAAIINEELKYTLEENAKTSRNVLVFNMYAEYTCMKNSHILRIMIVDHICRN
jgi:hypothetical protein